MREWLLDDWRYDHWANLQWAPLVADSLAGVGLGWTPDEPPVEPVARAADVFCHMIHGQRMWLELIGTDVRSEGLAWIEALHEGWMAETRRRDPDEIVAYVAPDGTPRARPYRDIVRHLTNHGTYHRGQLREIADAIGLPYPETDFTLWRTVTAATRGA